MRPIHYHHVDVFTTRPFGGNSLPVFIDAGLSAEQMLRVTRELRHFEAVFVERTHTAFTVRARVFDLLEELPFAGHPLIGAAAVLHALTGSDAAQTREVQLTGRAVSITTERTASGWYGMLDQGAPEFLGAVAAPVAIAAAFSLDPGDLHPALPAQVISTGLRYLVLPVRPGVLERARVVRDLTPLLAAVGAQFAVLFDAAALEIRHWNNDGVVEDVATGSAAGCIGAYRFAHGDARAGESFVLHQGRFAGRPSRLRVQPEGTAARPRTIKVGGDVAWVGRGTLEAQP